MARPSRHGSLDNTVRLWGAAVSRGGRCGSDHRLDPVPHDMEPDSSDAINVLDGYAWNQNRREPARRGGPPSQLNHGPEPDVAWHRREARESEIAGRWFAARWHLDRLIALRPRHSLYIQRAEIHIRSGHPAEATGFRQADRVSARAHLELGQGHQCAAPRGAGGPLSGAEPGDAPAGEKSSLGTDTEHTAKACLTVPDRPDLVAREAVLAERNLQLGPNDARMLYRAALADYRVGRYQSALDRLYRGRDVQKTTPTGDWPGYSVMSYAVEAMALAGSTLGPRPARRRSKPSRP